MNLAELEGVLNGTRIIRWFNYPTVGTQTLAEHRLGVYYVMNYLRGGFVEKRVSDAVLMSEPDSLTEEDKAMIELAELVSGGYYVLNQFNLGNRYMVGVLNELVGQIGKVVNENELPKKAQDLHIALTMALKNAAMLSAPFSKPKGDKDAGT